MKHPGSMLKSYCNLNLSCYNKVYGSIAQPGWALAWLAGGQGFEPLCFHFYLCHSVLLSFLPCSAPSTCWYTPVPASHRFPAYRRSPHAVLPVRTSPAAVSCRSPSAACHCGVMVLCRPLDFTPLVLPRGIGINDRIFFDFFTLLCIEKTACISNKWLYSRDFIIFPMPGKWYAYSSSINFFRSCFSCFICSRSICEILFSGVGKSSGIVPPIFSIVSRTSFPTV